MPGFDWEHIYSELDWLPGGALNAAHEATDRHAQGPRRDKVAMVWAGKNGEREDYTFGQMSELSDRFANVLKSLGVEKGDRVFLYMDRVPELYIAVLGTLKAAAIAGPMSPAFGPDPVRERMKDSGAKILVTQPHLRRMISGIVYELFELQHIDSRFQQGWHMTGDRARMDDDGYLWFEARSDDVISTAGRLVAPAEVERSLVQHPAVAQARAFGVPHPIAGQLVKASVVLGEGFEPTSELRREIMRFARHRLGTALAPHDIEFSTS